MKVYLVRHGEAADSSTDPDRALSEAGRMEIDRLAAYLRTLSVRVDGLWHSGKLRATQTAEALQEAVGGELEDRPGIAPNDDPETVAAELRDWDEENLCIVSHLPFVSLLASHLLAGDASVAWNFETGGILCLSREATGRWWVEWFLSPVHLPFV